MGTHYFQNAHNFTINDPTFNVNYGDIGGDQASAQLQRKALVEAVCDWLTTINFLSIQSDTFDKHAPGTGRWLLDCDNFQSLKTGANKVLWITGMPGSGKSILLSIAFEHMRKAISGEDTAALVVYGRYGDNQTADALFASLVKQILQAKPSNAVVDTVLGFYEDHKRRNTRPTATELSDLLVSLCRRLQLVVAYLDAVDELNEEVKEAVLETFAQMRANKFVTSRPTESLKDVFPHVVSLRVEDTPTSTTDIARFIRMKLETVPKLKRLCGTPAKRDQICHSLEKSSAGMFLVSALQIEALRHAATFGSLLAKVENSTPAGVDQMYEVTWDRVNSQPPEIVELVKRTLTWLAYAKRTLEVPELLHALASTDEGKLDEDVIPEEDLLLEWCCGLVTINQNSSEIRLSHATAYDFLQRMGDRLWHQPHSFIGRTCLARLLSYDSPQRLFNIVRYLRYGPKSMDAVLHSGQVITSRYPSQPTSTRFALPDSMFKYNIEHWVSHVKAGQDDEALRHFVVGSLSRWEYYPMKHIYGDSDKLQWSHIVAIHDLDAFMPSLVSSPNIREAKSGFGYTPLHLAIIHGHKNLVQAFLRSDAIDPNIRDEEGMTPLMAACATKYLDIVDLFLRDPRTQVNARKDDGDTALFVALRQGRTATIEALLRHPDVDPNIPAKDGNSPLFHAAFRRENDVFKLLLSHPKTNREMSQAQRDRALMNVLAFASHKKSDLSDIIEYLAPSSKGGLAGVDLRALDGRTSHVNSMRDWVESFFTPIPIVN